MKIIVCLDKRNGMLFNKRRQSADKTVYPRIMQIINGETLWIDRYSTALFEGLDGNVCVSGDLMRSAGEEAYCFVENIDISGFLEKVSQVIVFRWDRVYPADLYFPSELLSDPWQLTETYEFQGNSHDLITLEVYRR